MTIQIKAPEQCFLWCRLLCRTSWILTLEFVHETLKYDHWNKSLRAVLSCGAAYYATYALHCAGKLWFSLLSPWMKSYTVTFPLLRYCYYTVNVVLTATSVDEILQCGHSDESHSCLCCLSSWSGWFYVSRLRMKSWRVTIQWNESSFSYFGGLRRIQIWVILQKYLEKSVFKIMYLFQKVPMWRLRNVF